MAEQIEVYQSQHTAQQIEDAMGAVLSIGENGNWWIGDNDTGVFAGGVKVTGAKVGQTIVVNAVDSEGVPTSWRPFTLPDPGEKWERINQFTLTENALYVTIDKDSTGLPFSLKKMRVFMYLPKCKNTTGTDVSTGYANFQVNSMNARWINPSSGWDDGNFIFDLDAVGAYVRVLCYKGNYNGADNQNVFCTYVFKDSNDNGKILRFIWSIFEPNDNKPSAMAGATFDVWGVRA